MKVHQLNLTIGQLEPRKGGYFYLQIDKEIVEQLEKKKSTRLYCLLDRQIVLECGLNPLGNGHFYIMVATRHLKSLGKEAGDRVELEIQEHPEPLGVKIPEVLQVLLDHDDDLQRKFDRMTDGRKRSLIFAVGRTRDIDLQVQKVMQFLEKNSR